MALARMVMIAAGYEDCDDIDTLRTDPAFKIALGRGPDTGANLMSQPTLSRLENLAGWRELARIGLNLIEKRGEPMLKHPTEERLSALGLIGMAKALEEQRRQPDIAALSFEERF